MCVITVLVRKAEVILPRPDKAILLLIKLYVGYANITILNVGCPDLSCWLRSTRFSSVLL